MIPPELVTEIVFVTASGALSPGPLTFSVIIGGKKRGWKFGAMAATGHMAFEFPLYMLLGIGAAWIFILLEVKTIISIIGGLVLLIYALLSILDVVKHKNETGTQTKALTSSGFVAGFMFTAFNPYFIIWWATAGLKLVTDIVAYGGIYYLPLAYPIHVWMDYVWLAFIAYLAYRGRKIGKRIMDLIQVFLAVVMIYYGAIFLYEGFMFFK